MNFKEVLDRSLGWCSVPKMEALYQEAMDAMRTTEGSFVGVELGVFGARSIIPVAQAIRDSGKEGTIYGIDPWFTPEAVKGYEGENKEWWSKIDLPDVLRQAHALVRDYGLSENVIFITSTSDKAAHLFRKSKIDFLHVDGQHHLDQFKRDIDNYASHCRPGAPIVIDDVNWCGGTDALTEAQRFADLKFSIEDCSFFRRL